MITNNLCGGLCNQLFQISAGYSLARELNTDYAIDYTKFVPPGQGYSAKKYRNTIFTRINSTEKKLRLNFRQKSDKYEPIPLIDNLNLIGYFQSEKYFSKYKDEVKSLFVFPQNIKNKVEKKLSKFKNHKVGVHIRRGDYLSDEIKNFLPPVSKEYLFTAMELFNDTKKDFLLFTDDKKHVEEEIGLSHFEHLNNNSEIEDLYSLTQCNSIIMSNSSFSWWGSYLGLKKDKIIAPKVWHGKAAPGNPDIYNSNWLLVE